MIKILLGEDTISFYSSTFPKLAVFEFLEASGWHITLIGVYQFEVVKKIRVRGMSEREGRIEECKILIEITGKEVHLEIGKHSLKVSEEGGQIGLVDENMTIQRLWWTDKCLSVQLFEEED